MNITKTKIIRISILVLGAIAVTTLYLFLFQRGQKTARDMQRIADIKKIQSAFELLFQKRYTYADAATGCPEIGLLASECELGEFLPDIALLRDPGAFAYRVAKVPGENDYAISFTLEQGSRVLGRGEHLLTPHGIE